MPERFINYIIGIILLLWGNYAFAKYEQGNLLNQFVKTETGISSLKSKSFGEVSFFDGINSNMQLNSEDTISDQFSFCAWIKPKELLKKNMAIVGIPGAFWLRTTTKRELQFTQPGVVDNNTKNLLLSNQNWVFIGFVIDFPTVKIYLDDQLVGDFIWKNKNNRWGTEIFIGKDNWQQFFNGSMYRIQLFKQALSHDQIEKFYRQSVKQLSVTNGIVVYHSFDNRNRYFSSSEYLRTHHVTFQNDSLRGKVSGFTGNGDFIDLGPIPIDNAVTISTWIKPSVFNRDYGAIASFGHAFALRLTTGGALLFTIPQIADVLDNSAKLKLNKWQHVAVSFKEGNGVSFFLNGERKSFNSQLEFQNVVKELKIGTNLWNDFFKGRLDDLIIWNRILNDEEIREVYTKPSGYWEPILKQDDNPGRSMMLIAAILFIAGLLFAFLFIRRNANKRKTERNQSNPFIEKVNLVVDQFLYDSGFSVDRFAKELFVSKTKLYNELKKLTGKSPKEFMREQRLKKAAELLKKTDKPIAEISFETGFESRAYFNKCFKQYYNSTPTSFRKTQL